MDVVQVLEVQPALGLAEHGAPGLRAEVWVSIKVSGDAGAGVVVTIMWWYFIGAVAWLAGIVLAAGFWSTLFAIFVPFWAWYLAVERALRAIGWL